MIIIIGGAYYFYQKTMKETMDNDVHKAVEMMDVEAGNNRAAAMGQTIDIEDNGEWMSNHIDNQ